MQATLLPSPRSRDAWGCCNAWTRCLAVGVRWAAGMNLPLSVWDIEYPLGGEQSWQVYLQSKARARSEASSIPLRCGKSNSVIMLGMPRTFSFTQTPLFFMKHWLIPCSRASTNLHSSPPSLSITITFPYQFLLLGILGKESSGFVCLCFVSKSWLWALPKKGMTVSFFNLHAL